MKSISIITEKEPSYELREVYEQKYVQYLGKRYGKKRADSFIRESI